MTVLAKAFLPFVGCDFMAFSLFSAWHNCSSYYFVLTLITAFLNSRENLKVGTVLAGTGTF
ncbi:MAG TPA: hypothetical protein PKI37_06120, partial [Candidatus Cloacimonas sp.]|nr:hypothetical protein [Candidatus Cloacimonas sp.]